MSKNKNPAAAVLSPRGKTHVQRLWEGLEDLTAEEFCQLAKKGATMSKPKNMKASEWVPAKQFQFLKARRDAEGATGGEGVSAGTASTRATDGDRVGRNHGRPALKNSDAAHENTGRGKPAASSNFKASSNFRVNKKDKERAGADIKQAGQTICTKKFDPTHRDLRRMRPSYASGYTMRSDSIDEFRSNPDKWLPCVHKVMGLWKTCWVSYNNSEMRDEYGNLVLEGVPEWTPTGTNGFVVWQVETAGKIVPEDAKPTARQLRENEEYLAQQNKSGTSNKRTVAADAGRCLATSCSSGSLHHQVQAQGGGSTRSELHVTGDDEKESLLSGARKGGSQAAPVGVKDCDAHDDDRMEVDEEYNYQDQRSPARAPPAIFTSGTLAATNVEQQRSEKLLPVSPLLSAAPMEDDAQLALDGVIDEEVFFEDRQRQSSVADDYNAAPNEFAPARAAAEPDFSAAISAPALGAGFLTDDEQNFCESGLRELGSSAVAGADEQSQVENYSGTGAAARGFVDNVISAQRREKARKYLNFKQSEAVAKLAGVEEDIIKTDLAIAAGKQKLREWMDGPPCGNNYDQKGPELRQQMGDRRQEKRNLQSERIRQQKKIEWCSKNLQIVAESTCPLSSYILQCFADYWDTMQMNMHENKEEEQLAAADAGQEERPKQGDRQWGNLEQMDIEMGVADGDGGDAAAAGDDPMTGIVDEVPPLGGQNQTEKSPAPIVDKSRPKKARKSRSPPGMTKTRSKKQKKKTKSNKKLQLEIDQEDDLLADED